jgi:anaerobic C4-dicarboxylate transporter DcuA
MVTIPASFIGTLLGALSVAWRGKDLDDDPEYLRRLASGEVKPVEPTPAMIGEQLSTARRAAGIFLVGLTAVILIGMFPDMRPYYEVVKGPGYVDSDQISMGNAIMIIMIAVAGLIMLLLKASPERTLKGSIMQSGITAIISILGVSWLGSSFFEGNREAIVDVISGAVQSYPSAFAAGMFLLSTMLFSQAATVALIIPIGLALDMPVYQLVAFYPAVGGMFLLPTYGTTLAAVSFDQTGTTSLGTFLLNHSFMRPGMVALITSLLIGMVLSRILFM